MTGPRPPRRKTVERLRRTGDPRWREAACRDLRDLSSDPTGADLLAAALRALLHDPDRPR